MQTRRVNEHSNVNWCQNACIYIDMYMFIAYIDIEQILPQGFQRDGV